MIRYLFPASLMLLAAPAFAHDHAPSRGRLVFTDHQKPVVSVLDLDTGDVTHRFDVPQPNPRLSTAEDGRHVFISTRDENGSVTVLDSGLTFEAHGDHVDVEKGEVRALPLTLTGTRPAHFVSEKGWAAYFYDGRREPMANASVVLVKLDTLDSEAPVVKRWESAGPQHGVAVPLGGGRTLISTPKEAYRRGDAGVSSLPDGFRIHDDSFGVVQELDIAEDPARSCKQAHGHGSTGAAHVFGCGAEAEDGGVLVVIEKGNAWTSRKLAYPDGRRASTLAGTRNGRWIVANYGTSPNYDALIRIDPIAEKLSTGDVFTLPDGQRSCQFALASGGRNVVILLADGTLRIYDIASWKETARFEAVPAFDCAFDAKTPKPALAVSGDRAFVSDPLNARIREFDLVGRKQGLDIPVDGMPANIAGGMSGL